MCSRWAPVGICGPSPDSDGEPTSRSVASPLPLHTTVTSAASDPPSSHGSHAPRAIGTDFVPHVVVVSAPCLPESLPYGHGRLVALPGADSTGIVTDVESDVVQDARGRDEAATESGSARDAVDVALWTAEMLAVRVRPTRIEFTSGPPDAVASDRSLRCGRMDPSPRSLRRDNGGTAVVSTRSAPTRSPNNRGCRRLRVPRDSCSSYPRPRRLSVRRAVLRSPGRRRIEAAPRTTRRILPIRSRLG